MDIGSNSGRVIVVRAVGESHLEILADARRPLRLIRDVDAAGRLGDAALERVVVAVNGFQRLAVGAGARRTVAVATAAVREAVNGAEFTAAVEELTGVSVEVISGDDEARLAFLGAVHGLPVDSGLLVDIGGGSLELCHFRDRRAVRQWTLPLGAMRLTDRFLVSDPPKGGEMQRLRGHVADVLAENGVPALRDDEAMVGTGGTLRNLAKMHRAGRVYPIPRLHGYRLHRDDVEEIAGRAAGRPVKRRRSLPGLNADRADIIVGGALCAAALMDHSGAGELVVSGRGLREGVALERLGIPVAAAADVRHASVASLGARFSTWDERRAARRLRLLLDVLDALEPDCPGGLLELAGHAATLVDIGRSVDYYSRWEHAAAITSAADLYGFDHHGLVVLAALLELAGEERVTLAGFRTLVPADERRLLSRLAAALALADELEHRLPDDSASIRVQRRRRAIAVATPEDPGWLSSDVEERVHSSWGLPLRIETGG